MTTHSTIRHFADRLARMARNLLYINRLVQRVTVTEDRIEFNEGRIHALEHFAVISRQRLDALESAASTMQQKLEEFERRINVLETSVTPVIEKAFTQETYYQVEMLRKCIDQERLFAVPPPLRQRPRLAYVSPVPPERSGISNYSAELLPELSRYYDIEIIVVQPNISDSWIDAYCPVRNVAWFRQHAADYERVIYQFGNSPFHSHMFALLQEHPGVVVLHDFFLGSVLAYEESTGAMPGAWRNALYRSHGYRAVKASFGANGIEFARNTYPCNLEILQLAQGMIVHSEHSRQLARDWYGAHAADDWKVIPHLRTPVGNFDRMAARAALGIGEHAFVICSFGFVDPVKLSHRLLDAWLASRLRTDPHCELVLAGANHPHEYGEQLAERIRDSGYQDRIRITGWLDEATYKQYLEAADASVQLRSVSRGETSGAVLHCLNHGLPTIINANGAMADLPQDVVWKLPEAFDDAELVTALESLWENPARRSALGTAAKAFIRRQNDPAQCARQYAEAIDAAYANAATRPAAASLAPRQLLVDVSTIARNDLQTGIERVVRAQLSELLNNPPAGFRVEPVYLSDQDGEWHYRYARSYTCGMLGIEAAQLADAPADIRPGDVFYAPDFSPDGVIKAARSGIYAKWRALGVTVHFLVHDLLPVLRPEFFPEQADVLHAKWLDCIAENADSLICISDAVAEALRAWIGQRKPAGTHTAGIAVIHHGADLAASAPSSGVPEDAEQLLEQITAMPGFLMVGTIEPRKGHLQTLSAFEQLWREGEQISLVVVGKEGWPALPQQQRRTIPEIADRLRNHPELGKRLFWLQDVSDEYLQKIYGACTCLVFASEGEGFGLPLIEAAHHKLPIIARDLPVFREVAQQNAFYFSGLEGSDLAAAIHQWLGLRANGKAPSSTAMKWRTWAQNTADLAAVLAAQ